LRIDGAPIETGRLKLRIDLQAVHRSAEGVELPKGCPHRGLRSGLSQGAEGLGHPPIASSGGKRRC